MTESNNLPPVSKRNKRQLIYVPSRYLKTTRKPVSDSPSLNSCSSLSCTKDLHCQSDRRNTAPRHQSSPKPDCCASDIQLDISDSLASTVHPPYNKSVILHHNLSSDLICQIPSDKSKAPAKSKSFKHDIDVIRSESSAWLAVRKSILSSIVKQADQNVEEIRTMLSKLHATREQIIRINTLKRIWLNWSRSVVQLETKYNLLKSIVKSLDPQRNRVSSNQHSVDQSPSSDPDVLTREEHHNSLNPGLLVLVKDFISQFIQPVMNRLPVHGIVLNENQNCAEFIATFEKTAQIANLFSAHTEKEVNSLESLVSELDRLNDQLKEITLPTTQLCVNKLSQCWDALIREATLKSELHEIEWLEKDLIS